MNARLGAAYIVIYCETSGTQNRGSIDKKVVKKFAKICPKSKIVFSKLVRHFERIGSRAVNPLARPVEISRKKSGFYLIT